MLVLPDTGSLRLLPTELDRFAVIVDQDRREDQ